MLDRPDGALCAIEIKRGLSANPERGFYEAVEDIRPARAFLVHAGDDRYPIAAHTEAIGVRRLAEELLGLS